MGICVSCPTTYTESDGLFRLVPNVVGASAAPFLEQYRVVRNVDGHGRRSTAEYRALPRVRALDPTAGEWRIRRQSFETMRRELRDAGRSSRRVLDVGAGNGWLSYRLAREGHALVAVDLNDDSADGLMASAAYDVRFALVHADFDALPFGPAQFDVVVMNASLHYARDPGRTLRDVDRLVAPGGSIVVMDSPMFEHEPDGESMVHQQQDQLRSRYGIPAPIRRGVGYLTFEILRRAATTLRRRTRFVVSRGSFAWRLRRRLGERRLGRSAASFGVWVAR